MNAIEKAIKQSRETDSIVTLTYTEALEADLLAECDDSVDANGTIEAWANDPESETKMLWRVHLRRAEVRS